MAQDTNQVVVVGRLTRDAEMKYTNSGKALANFSIAVNDGWGENEHVSFFDVTIWGRMAESIHQYLTKGTRVCVSGSLKQERWQTNEGQNRSKIAINGRNLQLLGSPQGNRQQAPQQQAPPEPTRSFEDDVPF